MKIDLEYFAADEPSSEVDTYLRALRARKWVVLPSTLALAHVHGLINYGAISNISGGLISVPPHIAKIAILTSVLVPSVQYIFNICQFALSYRVVFRARITDRVEAKRTALRQALDEAEGSSVTAAQQVREFQNAIDRNEQDLVLAQRYLDDLQAKNEYVEREELASATSRVTSLSNLIEQNRFQQNATIRASDAIKEKKRKLELDYKNFKSDVPESRFEYKVIEVLSDAWRVLVPLIFMSYSLFLII